MAITFATCLLGCGTGATPDVASDATIRVWIEQCGDSSQLATGFMVGDRLAFTAAHPLARAESVEAGHPSTGRARVDVIALDEAKDIAVLRFEAQTVAGAVGNAEEQATGPVLTLVEPDADLRSVSLVGIVGDERVTKEAEILRQVDVSLDGDGLRAGLELAGDIQRGDSGGPVVDGDGGVVGMMFATTRSRERGWAIASSELMAALADIEGATDDAEPVALACPPQDQPD